MRGEVGLNFLLGYCQTSYEMKAGTAVLLPPQKPCHEVRGNFFHPRSPVMKPAEAGGICICGLGAGCKNFKEFGSSFE